MSVRLILAVCVLCLLPGPASAGAPATLCIVHTNDIHAHLAPFGPQGGECDPEKIDPATCRGGAARVKTLIDTARGAGGPALVLDAGDWFQGTLYYTALKEKGVAQAVKFLGYDAMVPGNH